MTVLVTGGSGTVGNLLAHSLVGAGHEIVLGVREPARLLDADSTMRVRRLDYDDTATYEAALAGIDSVFLVAPPADMRSFERMAAFIDTLGSHEIAHVVVNSAVIAEVDDDFPLRRIERAVEKSGCTWTHLRSQWYMHSLTRGVFAPLVAAGELALPARNSQVAFVDPADVVAVATAVLSDPQGSAGQVHVLTGPEALDWTVVARLCEQRFGHPVRYRPLSPEEYGARCAAAGVPAGAIEFLQRLFQAMRADQAARVSPAVHRLTGRQPRTLKEFLDRNG
jgi:uncharacterized protein YbjT (DUF2867 family)